MTNDTNVNDDGSPNDETGKAAKIIARVFSLWASSFASIRGIRGLIDSLVSLRSQDQLAVPDLNRAYAGVVPVIGEIISQSLRTIFPVQ